MEATCAENTSIHSKWIRLFACAILSLMWVFGCIVDLSKDRIRIQRVFPWERNATLEHTNDGGFSSSSSLKAIFPGCYCGDPSEWERAAYKAISNRWLTCSDPRALSRGDGQKVVSFSVFTGSNQTSGMGWIHGVAANVDKVQYYYPGWEMRVYHRYRKESELQECHALCRIREANPVLSLCYVHDLVGFPAVSTVMGTIWRFLPMIDVQVDAFVSRDADSCVSERDGNAVKEWLESGKHLHLMRDHPMHGVHILAGMWGANLGYGSLPLQSGARRMLLRHLAAQMVNTANRVPKNYKTLDQDVLATFVAPRFVENRDYVDHSSYHCNEFGFHSTPFPTRRNRTYNCPETSSVMRGVQLNATTMEKKLELSLSQPCPPPCRPDHGKHWTYC